MGAEAAVALLCCVVWLDVVEEGHNEHNSRLQGEQRPQWQQHMPQWRQL